MTRPILQWWGCRFHDVVALGSSLLHNFDAVVERCTIGVGGGENLVAQKKKRVNR